jgi:AbrB family looped-hinge helix DNA binding protein
VTVQTRVGKHGTVVIPAAVRRQYHLDEGTTLLIEERPDGVLLRPAVAPITAEERERFFDELDAMVAEAQQDPEGWAEELAERRLLENTLLDGLEEEPEWPDPPAASNSHE